MTPAQIAFLLALLRQAAREAGQGTAKHKQAWELIELLRREKRQASPPG